MKGPYVGLNVLRGYLILKVKTCIFLRLITFKFSIFAFTMRSVIVLFVCFVALRPKSTAMVMAGRSVHLTTLFPGQA